MEQSAFTLCALLSALYKTCGYGTFSIYGFRYLEGFN
jgi:hypothetical protein